MYAFANLARSRVFVGHTHVSISRPPCSRSSSPVQRSVDLTRSLQHWSLQEIHCKWWPGRHPKHCKPSSPQRKKSINKIERHKVLEVENCLWLKELLLLPNKCEASDSATEMDFSDSLGVTGCFCSVMLLHAFPLPCGFIKHGNGKRTTYQWFFPMKTSIQFGDFPASHVWWNQRVRSANLTLVKAPCRSSHPANPAAVASTWSPGMARVDLCWKTRRVKGTTKKWVGT